MKTRQFFRFLTLLRDFHRVSVRFRALCVGFYALLFTFEQFFAEIEQEMSGFSEPIPASFFTLRHSI